MSRILSLFTLTFLTVMLGSYSACASQTLTLSLESPSLNTTSAVEQTRTPVKTTGNTAVVNTPKKETKSDDKVKVGRVGIVTASFAYIYASKSSSSRRYSTVKADTPLAVVKEETGWYGVLMTNGATGWIPSKNVRMAGYELVAKKSDLERGSATSRGGEVTRLGSITNEMIKTAMQYTNVRYVYGGTNPNTGMDCSAFVRMIFNQYGMSLPRTAREQAEVGTTVPFDQLQPGDRLYFQCKYSYIDHCGIYAGNGYFVHCSSSRKGVGVDSLSSDFYGRSLIVAKRS